MQKNLALIAKYFKKIYKPTNNNLRTSSNSKNKNVDTALRYRNDDHSRQFRNQRIVNIAGTREKVGSQVVQQYGIECFNCKEYGHFAKEYRNPKRVKDSTYHKEKMLMYKQADQGVPLQAEQYDWLADTDEEVNKQEPKAHYSYMAKIQENEQNDVERDDERVALANLIANLKLDVDENIKTQKQLKKVNTTLAQELKECKAILAETSKNTNLRVSTSTRVNHKPNVSRPQLKSNQSRDKVQPNNSQVKAKKTQVEVHPRTPSVSNKMKLFVADTVSKSPLGYHPTQYKHR
nr:hypothetical protein [Tanacetum cinerariifolium]